MQNSATINSTVTQGGTINSTVTVGTTIQSTLTGGGIGPKGDTGAAGPNIITIATQSNLNGILTANGSTVSSVPLPLPVSAGGTGSSVQNFVDLISGQTVGGQKTFTSQLNVEYDYSSIRVLNTNSSQYAGAGFMLINTASTMGNEAGIAHYAGINDIAASKGYYAIDQVSGAGGLVQHLVLFDLDAGSFSVYASNYVALEVDAAGNLNIGANVQMSSLATYGYLVVQSRAISGSDDSGENTILVVQGPSASPQEATVTLLRDFGSGNKEFTDFTDEDYAGADHRVTINVSKLGTGILRDFGVRFWDQGLGDIAHNGVFGLQMSPASGLGAMAIGPYAAGAYDTTIALQVLAQPSATYAFAIDSPAGTHNFGITPAGGIQQQAPYPTAKFINTQSSQYAGPGLFLYNNMSSMGTQAGVTMYAGISDSGISQGYFTIDQVKYDASNQGHLLFWDLNAQTMTSYLPQVISIGNTGAYPLMYKRSDHSNNSPFYVDNFGSIHFGGDSNYSAQFLLDKDPSVLSNMRMSNLQGPASILTLIADTTYVNGPNAEATFTGKVNNAAGTGNTEFIDWFFNHYSTNGDTQYGIMMQLIASGSYHPFYMGYFDHADTASSEIIRNREAFFDILPDTAVGSYAGQTLTGTASTTASSASVVGSGTTFTSLVVGQSIKIGSNSRRILSITDDTHLTTDATWPNTLSGQTITLYNRFRGRMGIRVHDVSAFLDIAGGVGGSTVGSASLKIRPATALLTTPENGAIESDGSHLYFTAGGTRYQLDQQSPSGVLLATNNLSDLNNASTARTNLGLGTLATLNAVSLTSNVSGILPVTNGGTGVSAISSLTLDQFGAPAANVSMNSHKLTSVTDPSSAQDAATKNYVDSHGRIETRAMSTCTTAVSSPQQLNGNAYVSDKAVSISHLSTYVIAVNASNPTVELGIYDSSYNLLGSGTFTPTAEGVWSVTLGSPVTLTAGRLYYLALLNRASGDATTTFLEGSDVSNDTKLSWILSGQSSMPATASGVTSTGRCYWIMGY